MGLNQVPVILDATGLWDSPIQIVVLTKLRELEHDNTFRALYGSKVLARGFQMISNLCQGSYNCW